MECILRKMTLSSLLHNIMNEDYVKNFTISSLTRENHLGRFLLCREAIMLCYPKLTPIAVSKDEWNTKEDMGQSMKNALYIHMYCGMPKGTRLTVKNQACSRGGR